MTETQISRSHVHDHAQAMPQKHFAIAFGLTIVILLVEVVAGVLGNSLALLSDAGHVVTDVFALGLGWFAAVQATRPANVRNTWGYHRVGIVTALANASTLLIITGVIVVEAIGRLQHPEHLSPPLMIAAAGFAIAMNIIVARFLGETHSHAGHDHGEDLNQRAALLHVLTDIGDSAGVILAAVLITITGRLAIDAVISIVIALLLAVSALRVGRDALNILLEATPKGVDITRLSEDLCTVPGVYSAHHIHVWSISGSMRALSCHVIIDDMALRQTTPLLMSINTLLHDQFGIEHATVQFEGRGNCQHSQDCACGESDDCGCSADPAHVLSALGHAH